MLISPIVPLTSGVNIPSSTALLGGSRPFVSQTTYGGCGPLWCDAPPADMDYVKPFVSDSVLRWSDMVDAESFGSVVTPHLRNQ
jgi:hypothetical protein